MNNLEKAQSIATTFITVSAGVLLLSCVGPILGIRQVQKAQTFNLMADGSRMLGLAKTYDAKAAAMAMKTVMEHI